MNFVERILPRRRPVIVGFHAILIVLAYLLAYLIRFEFDMPAGAWHEFFVTLPFLLGLRLAIFAWYHLYGGLWRYVSVWDMVTIVKAVTIGSLAIAGSVLMFFREGFPRSILLLDWLLCIAFVGGVRLGVRVFRESSRSYKAGTRRVLIVGAGDAGEMLVREIQRNPTLDYNVVGFVDDGPEKQGRRIHDIEVVGTIDRLSALCQAHQVREVLIAIPSASGDEMRRIIHACRSAKVDFKTLPGVGEMMGAGAALKQVRRVQMQDLLRREPVRIDRAEIEAFIRRKRVLVTGAGGSIGSELCRQLASFEPEALVLLDRAENSLFFIEMELRDKYPKLALLPVVADVTDEKRIGAIFKECRPQVLFHAAAHKHVPLMEANKTEAAKNNVLGTMTVANAAWRAGVEDFVMISTDKAVRPSSVMGATKRLAEMFVQSLNTRIETRFMTVRFGNVLGSEGSVLQIFQRQIEAGGPVTVTHPDMTRYFMTIPEACQLVLQTVTQGKGGEIFLLDMGSPIRIVDLAKDLITLMGLDPEKDIGIKFTGTRPGEKIFEELINPEARIAKTSHEKIMVVETTPVEFEILQTGIRELLVHARAGDEGKLMTTLKALVPDYQNGKTPQETPPEQKARILLAGGDSYTRMTLKHILESGYQVFEVESGRQVVSRAKECAPHLVILDYHLRGASIRRLCEKMKGENGSEPPRILILAESAEAVSLEDVRVLGADDRLYKPIPVDILEKRVRRLLGEI
jgi:FlaA1/EpsC-like NDP-sugar epimerase